jgi:predicted alpha-1,2-mannosidase
MRPRRSTRFAPRAAFAAFAAALLALSLAACGDGGGPDAPAPPDAAPGDALAGDAPAPSDAVADVPAPPDAAPVDAASGADTPDGGAADPPLVASVDPRIGTGGRGWWAGNVFVGASAPFGLVQVGPDGTAPGGLFPWEHCSGYHALDDRILAFSHTHLHGTGIPDLGVIGFVPVAGPMRAEALGPARWSRFDRASEEVRPGLYAVTLRDPGVRVALTATDTAAHHRYVFDPPDGPGAAADGLLTVLVDVDHVIPPGDVRAGGVEVDPETGEVRAWARFVSGFSVSFGTVTQYVAARFDRPVVAWGTWRSGELYPSVAAQEGSRTGAWLTFDLSPEPGAAAGEAAPALEARVGVSYVDLDGARRNRDEGGLAADFAATLAAAEAAWAAQLGILRCVGGTPDERTVLATALYHTFLMPTRFSDVDGRYLGFDGAVHTWPDDGADGADGAYYTTFSLWDTYRTLHPFLILAAPERQRDMVRSLLTMDDQGGWLPKWPLANGYTNVMVGTFADIVVAETWLKGLRDFDPGDAWEAVDRVASVAPPREHGYIGRKGIADYLALGFVPYDRTDQSVARTLEFAVADAGIARFAAALGRAADAARYDDRARHYRNVWDGESGYFRPRAADGRWLAPFDPASTEFGVGQGYTEGNARQYLWLAPHDPVGLVTLHGGPEAFVARLLEFFAEGAAENERIHSTPHEPVWWMTTPPKWYWHGNEPDIHAAYLFAEAGRPDLTAEWVHWIARTLYHTGADGIPGNDDAGTLAAWYVFSALGVYPVPGTDRYLLGAPLFPRCELDVPGGTLVVEAEGEGPYVQSVTWDGAPVETPTLRHAALAGGGTLRFGLGPQPSDWARGWRTCDVRDHGAAGDGQALDTAALQAAVDACAAKDGGGFVRVPAGTYRTGSVELKSGVTLVLDEGATLLGSTRAEDYHPAQQALLWAEGAHDVAIVGRGTIDGSGPHWWAQELLGRWRPSRLVKFTGARHVRVQDVTLRQSPKWTLHLLGVDHAVVEGVRIRNPVGDGIVSPNTDGIDLEGCRHVRVQRVDIETGDDCVVLKNGDDTWARESYDIVVSDAVLAGWANGFEIGTESLRPEGGLLEADFHDVVFRDSVIRASVDSAPGTRVMAGVALVSDDGAHLRDILVENVRMEAVRAPFFVRLQRRLRGARTEPGTIEGVTFRNVTVEDALLPGLVLGLPEARVGAVTLDGVSVTSTAGGTADLRDRQPPERPDEYPDAIYFGDFPAFGLYARHVDGPLALAGAVTLGSAVADARAAVVYDDVRAFDHAGLDPAAEVVVRPWPPVATCDPDAPPTNPLVTPPPGQDGCPAGMAPLPDGAACIDRFEAHLVERLPDGARAPWSPFVNPGGRDVEAVSAPSVLPQAYVSQVQAAAACAAAGKRLCTPAEWSLACRGPAGRTYPYGDTREPGRCNDARAQHPAIEWFGTTDAWIWSELDHPCLAQLPDSLDPAGANPGCVTPEGVHDLMGNLHEWVDDPAGTGIFLGGFFVDTVNNGNGCLYRTTAHPVTYWDYSTGFRCCAEP